MKAPDAAPVDPVHAADDTSNRRLRSQKGRHRPRVRPYHKHGLTTLRKTVEAIGGRLLDGRTTLAKQLAAWKADLVQDLGGDVSTQQAAVVDLAVRTKLLLESIDAWLLVQPSLVNARKRTLLPVVLQRQQLADALARYMTQLGLERRARDLDARAVMEALASPKKDAPPKNPAAPCPSSEPRPSSPSSSASKVDTPGTGGTPRG